MPEHTVEQGECISSIAERHGFFWRTIWNHARNAELRERRGDPNVLYPGDIVFIPEKSEKQHAGITEKRHRFRKKGVPAKLRLIVEEQDIPLANTSYILEVDGKLYEGETDAQGLLEASIDPCAKRARLKIGGLDYELDLGAMDPLDEDIGVQARLQNLGFYDGDLDGEIGPETKQAIAGFQRAVGLEPTAELDGPTKQKLFSWQDEVHEEPTVQEPEEEEAEETDEDQADTAPEDEQETPDEEAEDRWLEEGDAAFKQDSEGAAPGSE